MSANFSSIYSEFNVNLLKNGENPSYVFEDYRLDAASLMLYRGEKEIALPPKAIETLLILVENQGAIVSKEELVERLWADTVVEESNLTHYLYVLRKTLGKTVDGKLFIETFRRRGYRFNSEARRLESFTPDSRQESHAAPKISAAPPHHEVERRGNVLRFVDRSETENSSPEALFAPEASIREQPRRFPIVKTVSVAALAFILLGALFYFRDRFLPTVASKRGDLTILRLTNGVAPFAATISPDGNYFVYHETDGSLSHFWLQQIGGSNRVEIIPPTEKIIHAATFSPDNQFVYYIAGDPSHETRTLYRVLTLGGASSKILDDISSPVSFSPDGRQMVFRRQNEKNGESFLITAAVDGSDQKILLASTGEQGVLAASAWSPDGNLIAFAISKTEQSQLDSTSIFALNLRTNAVETISPEKWDTCYRIAWTHDGQGLVFIGTKFKEGYSTRRDQVYYLSYPSGEARRLTTDGNRYDIMSLGVTDAGEILAVPFNRASQIWQLSGDAGTAVQITNGLADGRAGIAPLPDGRVGYIARTGDNLNVWITESDGTNEKQLTRDPPAVEELRASPDGRFFVFSGLRDGYNQLFLMNTDGTDLRHLTDGKSNNIDSTISPDGNWIVYDSGILENGSFKHLLRKISSAGGESVLLSDGQCATPHFSLDGKYLSCVYNESQIVVIAAENGTVFKTFETAKTPQLNCGARWSPDGKSLVYIVRQKKFSNLWRQPLDGGAPEPLTNFRDGDIYNFAFSPDGARLYVARGYPIRDAVLIKNFR